MKIRDVGEFGLIKILADVVNRERESRLVSWQRVVVGIGDDAAVWRGSAPVQLATTDSLIEGVHFTLDIATWEELGWKALAVNLSDIAAMGGVPEYALVSLALPGDVEVESVSSLYLGMVELANQFGVAIVGGNISSADKVGITVTVMGSAASDAVLRRSGALPGEQVALTGYSGLAAAGLRMLREKPDFAPGEYRLLRRAYLQPLPRVREGQMLLRSGVRTAIDISDGLMADLGHICEASGVSAVIYVDSLPVHPVLRQRFRGDAKAMVLAGGEDYELLFTARSEVIENVRAAMDCPVTVIGEISDGEPGKVELVDASGKSMAWGGGWEHFRSQP